jgi:hypothetical protein
LKSALQTTPVLAIPDKTGTLFWILTHRIRRLEQNYYKYKMAKREQWRMAVSPYPLLKEGTVPPGKSFYQW